MPTSYTSVLWTLILSAGMLDATLLQWDSVPGPGQSPIWIATGEGGWCNIHTLKNPSLSYFNPVWDWSLEKPIAHFARLHVVYFCMVIHIVDSNYIGNLQDCSPSLLSHLSQPFPPLPSFLSSLGFHVPDQWERTSCEGGSCCGITVPHQAPKHCWELHTALCEATPSGYPQLYM